MLFRHGFNAKQVQVWLGHHSPAFTLATYVHLLPSDLPELPDALDALTGGNRGQRNTPKHTETASRSRCRNPLKSSLQFALSDL